jgi:hypothetical protein
MASHFQLHQKCKNSQSIVNYGKQSGINLVHSHYLNKDYLYLRLNSKPVKTAPVIILFASFLLQTAYSQQLYITRTGVTSFTSNASLEVIKAESDQLYGVINPAERSFAFTIDNKSFQGFNSSLQQEHFYENYMETQKYPVSTFKGKIIEEIDLNSREEQVVRAKGMLDIHGVEQERIIRGTIRLTENTIQLHADFTILLEDHQIKIPRVVFEKIAEVIDVSITAELAKKID